MITKKPELKNNCTTRIIGYKNARCAFEDILLNIKEQGYTILLPAYIGYSPNEGSGIFDPIVKTNIKYSFYKMTVDLYIDIEDLEKYISNTKEKMAILLVHYFGYVDPRYKRVTDMCRKKNIIIVEDAAHAFYTEYYKHNIGKNADYIIYSIHKLFPLKSGGILKIKTNEYFKTFQEIEMDYSIWNYDIEKISLLRIKNAAILEERLKNEQGIRILRPVAEYQDCVPQTYPVILEDIDRYQVYLKMNKIGFGVVSLYHTLIKPLNSESYPISRYLSDKIINLPVHQDASEEDLLLLCTEFINLLNKG